MVRYQKYTSTELATPCDNRNTIFVDTYEKAKVKPAFKGGTQAVLTSTGHGQWYVWLPKNRRLIYIYILHLSSCLDEHNL